MTTTSTEADIRPFRLAVPDTELTDLRERLARTRWTDDPPGADWHRGVPSTYLRELAEYWRSDFDWRAQEAALNAFPQAVTDIDGQRVHFLHVRSPEPAALPLLIAHGYPGSIAEFTRIIGPLTDPRAHGGDPADAFHVVAPSIPGFGFSTPVAGPGWEIGRTADAFGELMHRLGYARYGLHGTDIGAGIVGRLAAVAPDRVAGLHVATDPGAIAATSEHMPLPPDLTDAEHARLRELRAAWDEQKGYLVVQSTRPRTIAHALTDSPAAQLAWIADSVQQWSDPAAQLPEHAVDRDQLLTNVSLYWFTRSGASAAGFLYDIAHGELGWVAASDVAQGWAVFQTEPIVRRLMDPQNRVEHWTEFDRGGHFPAMEVPDLLVDDIRAFHRRLR